MGPVRALSNILDRLQCFGRSRLERLGTFDLCILLRVHESFSATFHFYHLNDIRVPLSGLGWFVFNYLYGFRTLFLFELLRNRRSRSWLVNRGTTSDGGRHVLLGLLQKVGNVEKMNVGIRREVTVVFWLFVGIEAAPRWVILLFFLWRNDKNVGHPQVR